ncbi:MAG: transcriptional repressor [Fidelibacterota bacterium]|nr:MAG: transcriptional repressor [Candidatus Neomarinimicrobiota bacterium]
MEVATEHLKRLKLALRSESLRLTPQRLAVMEDILASEGHRECDDIFLSLRGRGIPVSRATIYRTLDVLEQVGFVRKLNIGDGRFRYENKLAQSHHDHLICLECGRIIEFVDRGIERQQENLSREHHFHLIRHIHLLFGICRECRQNGAEGGG